MSIKLLQYFAINSPVCHSVELDRCQWGQVHPQEPETNRHKLKENTTQSAVNTGHDVGRPKDLSTEAKPVANYLCVREREWVSVSVSEWVSECESEWVWEWVCECVLVWEWECEWVRECVSVREWVSVWEWECEWVRECVRVSVSVSVSECEWVWEWVW